MGGVKDPHYSVGSAATDGDIPLPSLILPHLLHESRSPDIQLQRLGVELQPIGKLTNGVGHDAHIQQEANAPWALVYKPASMTGMASTEARCALSARSRLYP